MDSPAEAPPQPAPPLSFIPNDVAVNITRQLPERGDRVLSHIATAAVLLPQIDSAGPGLRLSESVAYNVREALDSIAAGYHVEGSGLRAIHDAWSRVEAAKQQTADSVTGAVDDLHEVVRRSTQAKDREHFRTRQLLEHVRSTTGVEPNQTGSQPLTRYTKLRDRANRGVHDRLTSGEALALYTDTVAWLTWLFTPPDQRAAKIEALAHQPYTHPDQVLQVRDLCGNPLQLGMFLSIISDPGWLNPPYAANILGLPTSDPF